MREIKSAVSSGRMVILAGEMEVIYEGRTSSWLGRGERLLIIKQDRSVLIHRPFGYEPVNWQPPGSHIDISAENDKLVITSTRVTPPELLRIIVSKISHIYSVGLRDEADFQIHAREEDMKRAIILEPGLIEEGFRVVESERKVKGGFIDILGVDKDGGLVVVEIKRERVGDTDLEQLIRYATHIEQEFGSRPRKVIVAPMLSMSAARKAKMLGVEFIQLSPRRAREILIRKKGLDRFFSEAGQKS